MPIAKVLNMKGEAVAEINLADSVFGIKPHKAVMHAAVVNFLANQRQGTQSTLTRAEVSGGGRKPWRQKGTGHARQGSTRAPQWKHGGVAFGPKPRDYRYAINHKTKKLAIRSALSQKVLDNELIVLDAIDMAEIKTKVMAEALRNIGVAGKAILVLPAVDDIALKSARNVEGVKVVQVGSLSTYDILWGDKLVMLRDSVAKIEEVYAK